MHSTKKTRQLAAQILNYWEISNSHNQMSWVGNPNNLKVEALGPVNRQVDVCNTSMCAAGTAVYLSNDFATFKEIALNFENTSSYWIKNGAELLGLDSNEAKLLFYGSNDSAKELMKHVANGDQEGFDSFAQGREYFTVEESEESELDDDDDY